MDQFYLLEIIVNEIVFDENLPDEEIPQNGDQLRVGVIFAYLINTEIWVHDLRGFLLEKEETGRQLKPKVGKSILFPIYPTKLLAILSKYPLELCLKRATAPYVMGRVEVPWDYGFYDVVTQEEFGADNEEGETVTPAITNEIYEILSETQTKVADLHLTLKLTPLGHNVHAQFQSLQREFLVEGLSEKKYFFKINNTSTVFKVQLYQTKFERKKEKESPCPPKKPQITEKPKAENLTNEQLNKILCKHKNCYSIQEFARYGLGPAVSRPKTEGLHEIVIHHGMCHTFGALENYGPESMFLRPRTLGARFIGKNSERFSSPEYIKAVSDFVMRNRGLPDKRVCTCQYEPGERARPHPVFICWDLLQSYEKLVNKYRCMMGMPLLPPMFLPICLNPECPMRSFYGMSLEDPRCCAVFLKQFLGLIPSSACDDPECPFNLRPPCQMFNVPQPPTPPSPCTSSTCLPPCEGAQEGTDSTEISSSTTSKTIRSSNQSALSKSRRNSCLRK